MFERHFLPSSEESDQEEEACSLEEIPSKLPTAQRPASMDRKTMIESEKSKFFKPTQRVFNVNKNTDMLPTALALHKKPKIVTKAKTDLNYLEEITLKDLSVQRDTPPKKLLNNCFFSRPANKEGYNTPVKTPRELAFVKLLVLDIVEIALSHTKGNIRRSNSRRPAQKARLSAKSFISYNVHDFQRILVSPLQKNVTFSCTIKHDRAGFAKKIWGRYYLFLDEGWMFLLAACKRKWNKSPNYMITSKLNNFDKHSKEYLGKVRGNFMKNEYIVYDNGCSPKDKKNTGLRNRKELVKVDCNNTKAIKVLVSDIVQHEYVCYRGNCYVDTHKTWNHPKAEVCSKNFQILNEQQKVVFECVKIAENHYGLEFNWPFSPLQAFGLALSNFDK